MAHFLAKFCVCNLHYSDEIKRLKGIKLTDSEETFLVHIPITPN